MRVMLGNTAALTKDDKGNVVRVKDGSNKGRVTRVEFPEGVSVGEAFTTLTQAGRGVWANQSLASPAWVESDNETLEKLLAEHYDCPVGKADGFLETVWDEGDNE